MEGKKEWTKNTYLKRENHQGLEKSPLGFSGKNIYVMTKSEWKLT